VKTTKYILLLRDLLPIPRRDGKPSKVYNWQEIEVGQSRSLKKLRETQAWLKANKSSNTKIIREETTISVVKKGDLK